MTKFTAFNKNENNSSQTGNQGISAGSSGRKVFCAAIPSDHKFQHVYNQVRNKTFEPFSNVNAIKSAVTLSVIMNAIMLLGFLYNNNDLKVPIEYRLLYSFLTDLFLFYLLYIYNFKIMQLKRSKALKFWSAVIGSIIIAVVFSLIFSQGAIHLFPETPIPVKFQITSSIIKDLIVVLIVLITTLLFSSVFERQKTLIENEQLIVENIRIRYEVLKNQVDPHFLFNSLNTLDGLIGIDDDKAHEFVENISSVFRYTINNKEIMYLDEELDFTESYACLMKIRYGDNFQIQYQIEEKYRTYYIMPISLQLLVENAIKHNCISNRHQLIINIETTENDTIKVSNRIQPKMDVEPGTGIGLANLTERYKLLFQKEIIISKTDVFSVEIPLIKQLETTKTNML